MDMFASFYAGSYAVYNRMNAQRRQELYSNVGYYSPQIPQLIPLQTVSNSQITSLHKQNESKQQKAATDKPADESQSSSNERMKFSIDSILNEPSTSSKTPKCQQESEDSDDEEDKLSWLQCTRYKPPKLPRGKRKDCVKKRKLGRNPRVPFTQHQVAALEQKFRRTQYLSSMDVAELSTLLNLTETRVKIWFQNRRARERRDREAAQRGHIIQNKQSSTLFPGVMWPFPAAQIKQTSHDNSFTYSTATSSP